MSVSANLGWCFKIQSSGAEFATSTVKMSAIVVLIIAALAVILAVGLAYVPLRLLVGHIARNVREFIQRQRERRTVDRDTPDRRKVT
jgi:hypothetical protein